MTNEDLIHAARAEAQAALDAARKGWGHTVESWKAVLATALEEDDPERADRARQALEVAEQELEKLARHHRDILG